MSYNKQYIHVDSISPCWWYVKSWTISSVFLILYAHPTYRYSETAFTLVGVTYKSFFFPVQITDILWVRVRIVSPFCCLYYVTASDSQFLATVAIYGFPDSTRSRWRQLRDSGVWRKEPCPNYSDVSRDVTSPVTNTVTRKSEENKRTIWNVSVLQ